MTYYMIKYFMTHPDSDKCFPAAAVRTSNDYLITGNMCL